MTAPAPVELDSARDETMYHYFCGGACLPPKGSKGRAVCGVAATRKGTFGYIPGACWVCTDIWKAGFTCPVCGYRNFWEEDKW